MRVTLATKIGTGWTYATREAGHAELVARFIADHRLRQLREEQHDGRDYKGDFELLWIGDEIIHLVAGDPDELDALRVEARRIILEGERL